MQTIDELQGFHLSELARRCANIADNRSCEAVRREVARGLRDEWIALETPTSNGNYKRVEGLKVVLKKRMIDFLTMS
jgi:hypothetical protein